MKALFALLLTISAGAHAAKAVSITGKIFVRSGKVLVSAAPGQGTVEYEIRWLKGFPTKNICYYQRDALCPDYRVFYRYRKTTKSGEILVDAIAALK